MILRQRRARPRGGGRERSPPHPEDEQRDDSSPSPSSGAPSQGDNDTLSRSVPQEGLENDIRREYLRMLSELEAQVLSLRVEQDRWAEWRANEEDKLEDAAARLHAKELECDALQLSLANREKVLADSL